MKPLLNLLLLLMISTFAVVVPQSGQLDPADPCTESKPIPDIHRRDAIYQLSDGEDPINDRELVEHWYGNKSFKLLDEAPGVFRCGGLYPIWKNNSDEERATICVQDFTSECTRPFSIRMKTCKGYEVYELPSAPIHMASYCFVNSPDEPPMFNVTPSIIVDLQDEEKSYLLFLCIFYPSNENGLFYKTIWYVEGAPVHTFGPAQWTDNYVTDTILTEAILMDNHFRAGINIQCAVRAQYSLDGAPSKSGLSESKFVGVKVIDSDHFGIAEGETGILRFRLTVPFRCGANFSSHPEFCSLPIEVITVQNPGNCALATVIQSPSCRVKPITAPNWSQMSSVTYVGTVTSSYGEKTVTTLLKLRTPKDIPAVTQFWQDYDFGYVAVKVYKNTSSIMYKRCSIRNDPYLYTFNSWDYRSHTEENKHGVFQGIYLLYQDGDRNIEVQIETEVCSPEDLWWGGNPFCTCGVAVRAGRTVFEISHCNTTFWQIGYTACGDGGDVMIVRRSNWNNYEITLPTGTMISVFLHEWDIQFINVYIYPTPLDKNTSRGLCGRLSDNPEDDMTMRNGQLSDNSTDFVNSWSINKDENLFDPNNIESGIRSFFKPVYQYCTCDEQSDVKNQITCSPMAAKKVCEEPKDNDVVKPRDCFLAKRKKRMAPTKRRRFKRAVTENSWRNGWNVSAATAYCESKFAESASVQLVKDVPGVDLYGPLSDCIDDIKASGTTLFTAAAIASVGIKARREAMVNPVLSEPDPDNPSTPTLYDIITKHVCPGDCSGKGTCSDGKCRCHPGYEGGDCSIDVTTPPQLVHAADDGLCDLSAKDCLQTEILGDVFSGGKDSKCLVKRQMVLPSGERETVKKSSPNSIFESISEVFCPLPELSEDEVVVSINISVSHAGFNYGNELSVLVYDSSCVNVDHSTGTWTVQTGFCVYKGRCTSVGSLRQDNPCVRCVEEEGEDPVWKRLTEKGCTDGNLHIGENTGSVMSSVSLRVTSLLMLYHALLQIF